MLDVFVVVFGVDREQLEDPAIPHLYCCPAFASEYPWHVGVCACLCDCVRVCVCVAQIKLNYYFSLCFQEAGAVVGGVVRAWNAQVLPSCIFASLSHRANTNTHTHTSIQ